VILVELLYTFLLTQLIFHHIVDKSEADK